MKKQSFWLLAILLGVVSASGAAMASGAVDWQLGFQEAASPVAERIHNFHTMLLYIITAITLFVTALLVIVMIRFNAKANPKPSLFAHNTPIEILWTVVPVLILIAIAIPSMRLLYYGDRTAEPEMTLKVTGNQWYWSYEYPDQGNIAVTSYMLKDNEIDPAKGQKRLLSTDNPIYLPVDTNIQLLVTAADVLHAFTVPALGFKIDAVPGRINESWTRITKPGVYYGQCSELCGKDHAFMPVEIHAVSKEEFAEWVVAQQGGTPAAAKSTNSTNLRGVE
jgi:cytochrome c oxidase subunit 2